MTNQRGSLLKGLNKAANREVKCHSLPTRRNKKIRIHTLMLLLKKKRRSLLALLDFRTFTRRWFKAAKMVRPLMSSACKAVSKNLVKRIRGKWYRRRKSLKRGRMKIC